MKIKKMVIAGLVTTMVFGGTTVAFAAQPPINLSLDGAYKKILTDSPQAKEIEFLRKTEENVARGAGENISDLRQLEKASKDPNSWVSYDPTDRDMAEANKDFATAQYPKNDEARKNVIKTDTFKKYYTLKNAEKQLQIAKDNLAVKQKLLDNTKLKLKVGTVSKNDVLKAEVALTEAQDANRAANNGVTNARMAFNQFMGYPLDQTLVLTDPLSELPMSTKSLDQSIKDATLNRNEIGSANFGLAMAKMSFSKYKQYPSNSSKYVTAQLAVMRGENAVKDTPILIEMDVRSKYLDMQDKSILVQSGKKSVNSAKETARLAQLQYDLGLATLPDVNTAQLGQFTAEQSLANTILEYNLAVDAYNLCSGVGTTTATIN